MTNKQFTRAEVNEIIEKNFIHYFKVYGDDMSLSEQLFFKNIHETIGNGVDYGLELLEEEEIE